MESLTNHLFKPTNILCPKCCKQNLNELNLMLICDCGWYHVKQGDKEGNIQTKQIGNFIVGEKHIKPYNKQYAKAKSKFI